MNTGVGTGMGMGVGMVVMVVQTDGRGFNVQRPTRPARVPAMAGRESFSAATCPLTLKMQFEMSPAQATSAQVHPWDHARA